LGFKGFALLLLIIPDEVRSMYVCDWFPRIIAVRISCPFYEVLKLVPTPMQTMIDDCFYFEFFFSFDQVGWWMGEVWTMRSRLLIFC